MGGRKFVLGIKSWSGGIGVSLLAQAAREPDGEMRRHIAGAIVMHPGTFDAAAISAAVGGLEVPFLLGWARDDAKVPYSWSRHFTAHRNVELVTYESGGHHNFDGA